MNKLVESKISKLVEENWKEALRYATPLAGAAGLGYMGYQAGEDFSEGIKQASDANMTATGFGKDLLNHFTGETSEISPQEAFKKFLTPGQDGSWREYGEAVGNQQLREPGTYIPKSGIEKISGQSKLGGAVLGAGIGHTVGKIIAPDKKENY